MTKYQDIVSNGRVVGKRAYDEDEPRNPVSYPAKKPTPLVDGETLDLQGMRSTKYVHGALGSGYHYGAYIALWRGFSMKLLENDWVVSRHDEDDGTFEILLRTGNEKKAREAFNSLKEDYPEMDSPHGSRGGYREGAGRKPVNGTPMRSTSLDLPTEDFEKANVVAKERGISRSELLRALIHQGLEK